MRLENTTTRQIEVINDESHFLLPPAGECWPDTRANLINAWDVATRPTTFDQRPEPEIPMLSFSPLKLWMHDWTIGSGDKKENRARKHFIDLRQGSAQRLPFGAMVAESDGTVASLMLPNDNDWKVNPLTAGFFIDRFAAHAMLARSGSRNIDGYLEMEHLHPSDMLMAYLGEQLATLPSNIIPFTSGQGPYANSSEHGPRIARMLENKVSSRDLAFAIGMRMIELQTPEGDGHDNDPLKGLQELYHRLYRILAQGDRGQLALTLSTNKPNCHQNIRFVEDQFDLLSRVITD